MAFNRKEYMREWMRRWREVNPAEEKARKRRYYQKNTDKVRAAAQEWRSANPEKVREIGRRRQQKKVRQKEIVAGRPKPESCEICNQKSKLHWDHCHASGIFRGWICFRCNAVLGLVEDDRGLLSKLEGYLNAVQVESPSGILQQP